MVTRVLEIEMMALVREAQDLTEAFHKGKRLSVKMQKEESYMSIVCIVLPGIKF